MTECHNILALWIMWPWHTAHFFNSWFRLCRILSLCFKRVRPFKPMNEWASSRAAPLAEHAASLMGLNSMRCRSWGRTLTRWAFWRPSSRSLLRFLHRCFYPPLNLLVNIQPWHRSQTPFTSLLSLALFSIASARCWTWLGEEVKLLNARCESQ